MNIQTWRDIVDRIVPAIDPNGLSPTGHCCEYSIHLDRERIRQELLALRVYRVLEPGQQNQTVLAPAQPVYVCRMKDVECGDVPSNWCAGCPKLKAHLGRGLF